MLGAKDSDELMEKIQMVKLHSLDVISYAHEMIKQEEQRCQIQLSQFEKNRLIISYLKFNQAIKDHSRVDKVKHNRSYNNLLLRNQSTIEEGDLNQSITLQLLQGKIQDQERIGEKLSRNNVQSGLDQEAFSQNGGDIPFHRLNTRYNTVYGGNTFQNTNSMMTLQGETFVHLKPKKMSPVQQECRKMLTTIENNCSS